MSKHRQRNKLGKDHGHAPPASTAHPVVSPPETELPKNTQAVGDKHFYKCPERAIWTAFQKWDITISAITMFAVIAASTIYAFQLFEMRKSTNAATAAAKIAGDALTDSTNKFEADERPYVVVTLVAFAEKPVVGGTMSATVMLKNTGKTPAINIHFHREIGYFENAPTNFAEWVAKANGNISSGTLGAGIDTTIQISHPYVLKGEDIDEIQIGKSKVFVFGVCTYQSVFNKDATYETYVCSFYNPQGVGANALNGAAAKEGNEIK